MQIAAEFPGDKVVLLGRENQTLFAVQIIHNFHVEIGRFAVGEGVLYAVEFYQGRLYDHELRGHGIVQPVRSRHGNRSLRQEEKFIHRLCKVSISMRYKEDPKV